MTQFASVSDLEARWRTLSPSEKTLARTLLVDASLRIVALYPGVTQKVLHGVIDAGIPRQIVCSMVQRSMASEVTNANSVQETVGPFSHSITYSNPSGDLYLTKAEKSLLRGGFSGAFSVDLGGE